MKTRQREVKANGGAGEGRLPPNCNGGDNYELFTSCPELRRRRRGPGIDAPQPLRGSGPAITFTNDRRRSERSNAGVQPPACPPTYNLI